MISKKMWKSLCVGSILGSEGGMVQIQEVLKDGIRIGKRTDDMTIDRCRWDAIRCDGVVRLGCRWWEYAKGKKAMAGEECLLACLDQMASSLHRSSLDVVAPRVRSVIRQFEIRPKHRLRIQPRILDDAMHMQEQPRIPSREIPKETFWHRSKMALHVVG
jgi:hypothetical protein